MSGEIPDSAPTDVDKWPHLEHPDSAPLTACVGGPTSVDNMPRDGYAAEEYFKDK